MSHFSLLQRSPPRSFQRQPITHDLPHHRTKEKENKARLPIKKRKLRGSFDLTCNEVRQIKVSIQQLAMDPTTGPSLINASTIETITQDFNEIVTFDLVKAKRRKLLTKTKTFWSTKLGMSKVQFCNGLWLLARNKANARN